MKGFKLLFPILMLNLNMASSQSYFIEANGIIIHYKKYGSGDPLLLLHGWTQNLDFWQPFIEDLSKDFEVYAIDLRGHGKTTPLTEGFSIKEASNDINEFIKKNNLSNVKGIGLSYGGLVLLESSLSSKDLLKAIILIGVSNKYDGKDKKAGAPVFTYESLNSSFKNFLLQQHYFGEDQIKALFNPDLNYFINIDNDQLRTIKAKTLIVNGDSDEIMGIEGAINLFKCIPNSSLFIVPQKGHIAIGEENKKDFLNYALNFFK